MLRPRVPHRSVAVLALSALVVALAVTGAAPVPTPVHVRPGVVEQDGRLSWVPAVQHVTGEPGELVAIDLALDDGTEHDVDAQLAVRSVEIDAVAGARPGRPSDALELAVDRVVLRPGERGVFRAVAEIPSEPTVVGVEARPAGDAGARPMAIVPLAPEGRSPELSVSLDVDGTRAEVALGNASPFPALVDVGVTAATWLGPRDDLRIGDVLVPARGERTLGVSLSRGLGRRSVAVAAAARGAAPDGTVRARVAEWPMRTVLVVGAGALTALAGLTVLRVLRRS